MELAQRHVKHRLLLADLLQAIQGKIETFTDADSSSSYEAEGIGLQRVVLTELLLQALILVWGKRSGQVMVAKGEVLAANQIRGKGMTVVGQVTQQTAEQDQIQLAGCVAERRPLLAEKAEPAQQMRIATQLGGLMQVGEVGVKVSKESMHTRAIFLHRARPEGGGKPLNLGFQDLVQGRWQSLHGILSGTGKVATRCWTARAYSRQTSWGASCT